MSDSESGSDAPPSRPFPLWGALLWGLAVIAASLGMWLHAAKPGKPAQAPPSWPEGSAIAHDPKRFTLLVFAHPACACTAATMDELGRFLRGRENRVRVHVLFESYDDVGQAPAESRAWAAASALGDVHLAVDVDGAQASLFDVQTSGQVLAYDPSGTRRFAGGITRGRGERGESQGATRLAELIDHEANVDAQAPVYGCALLSPGGEDAERTTN